MTSKIVASASVVIAVALVVMVALGIQWLSGGWVPGWLAIVLFMVSPVIADVSMGVLGISDGGVMAMLIFASVGIGGPALAIYVGMMLAGLI